MGNSVSQNSGPEHRRQADGERIPFDDCLRILVNTPPQPKKAVKQGERTKEETPPEKEE